MKNSITSLDAETHFSELLDRVNTGEEILITRQGKVAAKIVPVNDDPQDIKLLKVTAIRLENLAKIAAIRLRNLAKEINLQSSSLEDLKKLKISEKK